jgi:hypothetical protein
MLILKILISRAFHLAPQKIEESAKLGKKERGCRSVDKFGKVKGDLQNV